MKCRARSFAVACLLGIVIVPPGVAVAATQAEASSSAASHALSSMSMAQKHAAQQYFTAHSLDFSPLFKRYHPGPYWILAKAKQFKLTPAQTKQQEDLKNAMAMATIKGNMALKQAYAKYAADARLAMPSLNTLRQDIDAVGHAQTQLAQVMVPYHLDSYAALTPTQQALYTKLVAQQK